MAPPRTSGSPVGVLQQAKDIIAGISFDLLLGKVAGFTTALIGVYLSARKIQEALKASAGAETLKSQFIALGQSASQAEEKVASLAKMAASGAVSFESLGNASKTLRVLGGAAADTERNIRQISDVFAASGAPVNAVAAAYAQFYQAIQQGGDVSGAAQDMANLGGITQNAAAKIRDMAAAGASSAAVLRTMQMAMDSTKGASEAMRDSVAGLEAQLRNLEQASNIEIGNKFLEGEKAGLRAAIAFQKLKDILQSGLADSIAPMSSAWNELKEAIFSSDAAISVVKGLTVALKALVLVAAGGIFSAIVQGASFLITALRPIASVMGTVLSSSAALRAGMGVLWAGLRVGASILMTTTAGLTLLGAALVKAGIDAYNAYKNINKFREEAEKDISTKQTQFNQNQKDIALVRNPEEQQKKADEIDAQIADLNQEKETNQKALAEARETQQRRKNGWIVNADWNLAITDRWQDQARVEAEEGKSQRIAAQERALIAQKQRLMAKGTGVDNAEDQRLRESAVLERNIRNQGIQDLQSALSPEMGLEIGKKELERIQGDYNKAIVEAPKIESERRQTNSLTKKVDAAKTVSDFTQSLGELSESKTTTEAGSLDKEVELRTALREQKANQEFIASQALNFTGNAERKVIKRSDGVEVRETQEEANARRMSEGVQIQKDARAKLAAINQTIAQRYGGDESQISAETTQSLARQRDDAIKRMDPVELRRQMQGQMDQNQRMEVAKAARENTLQKQRERTSLEGQLAYLSNNNTNNELKAGASSDQQVRQLEQAKAAAVERETAAIAYQQSIGTADEEDRKKALQKAEVNAVRAGAGDMTAEQIDQKITDQRQQSEISKTNAKVESAEKDSALQREGQRASLEAQVSTLSDNEANLAFKAGAESKQRVDQLKTALTAAQEYDQKSKEYQASKGGADEETKKKELEQAKINAAKAGTEGQSVAEIQQKLNAEQQILQVKLNAAKIAENAAKAEYEATQRRLALERQMVELRGSQAQQLMGDGYGVKGEGELKGEAQDKEIAKKEEALKAAEARDAAEAANIANPSEATAEAVRKANEEAAKVGVTKDTKTTDIKAELQQLNAQRADALFGRAERNNRSQVEMQIQGARIQEQYAPNSEASQSAKVLADKLEDQMSKADRVKQLTSGPDGMSAENAERVADIEVQRSRILSNIEKEGRPEVSSMARIGGSSGWAGMVGGATQDKQAKLEQLNQQMVNLLASLASDSAQSMSYARTILNNNK